MPKRQVLVEAVISGLAVPLIRVPASSQDQFKDMVARNKQSLWEAPNSTQTSQVQPLSVPHKACGNTAIVLHEKPPFSLTTPLSPLFFLTSYSINFSFLTFHSSSSMCVLKACNHVYVNPWAVKNLIFRPELKQTSILRIPKNRDKCTVTSLVDTTKANISTAQIGLCTFQRG